MEVVAATKKKVMRVKTKGKPVPKGMVTSSELSRILGVSTANIAERIKHGSIKRNAAGYITVEEVERVKAERAFRLGNADAFATQTSKQAIQLEKMQVDLDKAKGNLIPKKKIFELSYRCFEIIKKELLSPKLGHAQKLIAISNSGEHDAKQKAQMIINEILIFNRQVLDQAYNKIGELTNDEK